MSGWIISGDYGGQYPPLAISTIIMVLHQDIYKLTHWGRVMHICGRKLTNIGSDNGLSPGRRQAIIWTNDGILLVRTNLSEILIEIHSRKCFWNCRLRNGGHFILALMCGAASHQPIPWSSMPRDWVLGCVDHWDFSGNVVEELVKFSSDQTIKYHISHVFENWRLVRLIDIGPWFNSNIPNRHMSPWESHSSNPYQNTTY